MQHPTFSAPLVEQHRHQLRGQADQIRLSRPSRPSGRPRRPRHCPLVAASRPAGSDLSSRKAELSTAMRLITRQQLKAELDAGQPIKLVMTAGPWQVRAKHIPGTLKLITPEEALRELRPDDRVVVYAIDDCLQSSVVAWEALTAHGYRDVRCYAGGLNDWEAAGYPVEGGSVAAHRRRRWPHGHSRRGRELQGGCPHCDQGWSGAGWPTTDTSLAAPGVALANR